MTAALQLIGVGKRYDNGVEAVRQLDLTVEAGDFFALLGPNGAGKSTTIGMISSLVNRSEGEIRVFGEDPKTAPARAKPLLGLVPQEFNFNIWEPVEEIIINQAGYYGIARDVARQRAEKYLRQLGLWEKRRDQAMALSGGMKRRLMIARALVHEPPLLILDEPTAGVDIELRRSMWEFLREINAAGTTIILTTHYLEEAESLCRNIAIIDHGELVENTSMRSLLAKLNQESFVLDLAAPLNDVPDVPGYALSLNGEQSLIADVEKEQGLTRLFSALGEQGIEVLSMRNKTNRLEQLFIERLQRDAEGRVQS